MSNHTNAVYQYAVVRFMPFIETREFANVGIVLIDPKKGKFRFRLAPTRFGRVTKFFDDIDGRLYRNAIDSFNWELERVEHYCDTHGLRSKELVEYFTELTRHRESVLHFSAIGRMMGEAGKIELELQKLYQRFVARDFVNEEYREQQMVKVLKQTFAKELIVKYTQKKLKAGVLDIPMPLVYEGGDGYKVIKPLAFEQNTPLKAYEHGIHWAKRVEILIKKHVILPERALFTVEKPVTESSGMVEVYDDIVREIIQLGVQVEQFNNTNKIIQFARFDNNETNGANTTH
ncbi:DUF3037 domain-containing protein [Aliiglaciecola sp. NS0011-25]|uniref:DUF3037 domain-containing protein n=1 Tax=Aliiglaciecola sp. NS0011-25 TaxID=3127654 RepID=UPI003102C7B5